MERVDRIRVRNDAPREIFTATKETDLKPLSLKDIEFNILERKDLRDGTGFLVFEMKNADPAIANALRRIMIAEVETVAVDRIGLVDNTSIIQDEVLAHRIGLVPFNIDPEHLKESGKEAVYFELFAQCTDEEKDGVVRSSSLQFDDKKNGDLKSFYESRGLELPKPIHDDIPLARLLPGQRIWLVAECRPGVGKTHAKFSPVATASYRLMPKIFVDQDKVRGEAEEIMSSCPKDVFDIEDGHLVAARPRDCTMCRECIRRKNWEEIVTLERDRNHFIFSVESVGMLDPAEIFRRACNVLARKAADLKASLEE